MLVTKQEIKSGDVYCMKLITSEEVVAKVIDSDKTGVLVHRPMLLQLQVNEANQSVGMVLLPTFILGGGIDVKTTIKHEHIMTIVPAEQDLVKGYIRQTTGIVIPETGSVIA